MSGFVRLARKAGWNLADQLLSAATNAALSFMVARTVGARGFGAFAVGFLVFTLMIGIGRALVGSSLSIKYSSAVGAQMHEAVVRGIGTVIAVTVPASVLCAAAGLLIGGILRPALLAFALVLPALIVQDNCRLVFFAQSRPDLATLNDALWAVVQFVAITALIVSHQASTWSLALAWGGSAAVCSVVALVQLRAMPRPSAAAGWLREHRQLGGYLVAEYLVGAGAMQGGLLLVGGFLGIDALGSLRAALVLTGPFGVLVGAAMTFGLPEVSRRTELTFEHRWRLAAVITATMLAVGLAYTLVLLLIPDALGTALFGATWAGAHAVLLPVSLVATFGGGCVGPVILILGLGQSRASFWITVVEAVMVLIALLLGATLGGARGAAWGLAVQYMILLPMWFVVLRGTLHKVEAERPPVEPVVQQASLA